ncbi:MAG: FAD-binding oxidoreductase [Pseudomonadota bacterium]
MIITENSPIAFNDPLPDKVDVVVIGGGVIGTSTAYFLTQKGFRVLLCDKGRIAGEQSSRNWGWIRQQGRDEAELPIVMDSLATWESLSAQLDDDIGFSRQGVLYTASNETELAQFEEFMQLAERYQLDTRLLSSNEVDKLVQDKPGQWVGGMFTPSDGRAEPFRAVPALARLLKREGGVIREACAVRGVELTAGRVSSVVTEHGSVAADAAVLAGGAWSSRFLGNLGVKLPQLTVRATVARTAPAAQIFAGNAALDEVAIRRRQDGGYTIAATDINEHFVDLDSFRFFFKFLPALRSAVGFIRINIDRNSIAGLFEGRRWKMDEVSPFELQRVLNPLPSRQAIRKMRKGLRKRAPQLALAEFVESWAGMIDVTPDVVPVMDQIPQHDGLFVATGFSGHGFGIGPGAGKVMAGMVAGETPNFDLGRFRYTRFFDGSPIVPGPGL